MRKRVPTLTLLSLPEEIILYVLQCLSAEDILAIRAVSTFTRHVLVRLSVYTKWLLKEKMCTEFN